MGDAQAAAQINVTGVDDDNDDGCEREKRKDVSLKLDLGLRLKARDAQHNLHNSRR